MSPMTEGIVAVPGADLYYRLRGSGPLLLIIQGGDGDAEASDGLAGHLLDFYTVLTYDRRGLSRSKLHDGAPPPSGLETHGDDVHLLLAAVATEPVSVLGSSIGALIGLELVSRHPEQVRAFVAHEPPSPALLSGAERANAERFQQEVEDLYAREGVAAAMRKFVTALSDFSDREPDVELPRPGPLRAANLDFFLAHDTGAVSRYRLDIPALKSAPTRIVPAAGRTSREIWTHHCAARLAELLGVEVAEFPGGHNGFVLHPRAFAARLREVFEDA